jgi:hypothetical protein
MSRERTQALIRALAIFDVLNQAFFKKPGLSERPFITDQIGAFVTVNSTKSHRKPLFGRNRKHIPPRGLLAPPKVQSQF